MAGITVLDGGSSTFRHNYYDPEDFFSTDPETGSIRRRDGMRVVSISEDFVASLLAGTAQELGEDAARAVMYQTGYQWALEDMKNYQSAIEKEFGNTPISEMHLNFVLETWWWPLTTQGWGGWKVDFEHRKQGLMMVDLTDSVVAQSLERLGKPVCYWYAGLFGGLFTHLSRRVLNCIEIQCYASGHDVCKFLIGMEKKVNAAAYWVEEGASANDIMESLN